MEDSEQRKTGDDDATDMVEAATIGGSPTQSRDVATTKGMAKPRGRTTRTRPVQLNTSISTEKVPDTLVKFADSIRNIAKQLTDKRDRDTIELPIAMQRRSSVAASRKRKSEKQNTDIETIELKVPTSAEKMAEILSQLADKLQGVAEKPKGEGPIIEVVLSCNGGGDGLVPIPVDE